MARVLKQFLRFLEECFRGPTGSAEFREVFICRGDPMGREFGDGRVLWVHGSGNYISTYI